MRFGIRELILLAVLLAVPVSAYMLVFRPQNRAIERAKGEIAHREELLDKLREETARSEDLRRANDEIAQRIASVEARLPTDKEVDRIMRQVSDLAIQSGLASPAMQSEKPVAAALYFEQPLTMETSGSWDGFYRFLTELERLPRQTRIPAMTLERDSKNNGQMNVEFTLSIYFQDDGGSGR
ncbi:MAG: type 4a pilus biogenesis protein PilO [Phycisphaeraceae bacterium]|nr:type 4a pilus biogenesis protein PilO [Phycisphaeraceae bacterium]